MNDTKTFPYSVGQLNHLQEEVEGAGSFLDLMFEKKAVIRKGGMDCIAQYNDIEKYKKEYVTGIYETLQPFYETDMPYLFWNDMYKVLLRAESESSL